MQPLSGNQRPMNMSLVLRLPRDMRYASFQILFKCPTPAIVFETATKPSCFAHFWQGGEALAPATQNDASTSKSGTNMWCFVHFDFEMCFAPQRRTPFEHLNFQKCSEAEVSCTFWLRHVLRATTACIFSTSQLLKAFRSWGAFSFFTCKCQRRALFRHLNFKKCSEPGVLCAFWLGNVLCATTQRHATFHSSLIWPHGSAPAALVSLLFDPPEPQIIGKHSVSRLAYLFAHLDLLSSSLLWLRPSLLFICPYCRKFDF